MKKKNTAQFFGISKSSTKLPTQSFYFYLISISVLFHTGRYTGYVPQYRYRIGETFGKTTHKIMLDPHIQLADKLVLSDRSSDNYQVRRAPRKKTFCGKGDTTGKL